MPGFNPENINIHDLTIEEPEKQADLAFDPEKDLTDDYWKDVDKYVSGLRDLNHPVDHRWGNFLMAVSNMKVIDKEVQLEKGEYDSIKDEVEQSKRYPVNFIEQLSRVKIIDPAIKIDMTGVNWKVIEEWIRDEGYGRDIAKVAELKIAGFDKFKIDNSKVQKNVEDLLRTARGWDGNIGTPWYDFMRAASAAKIIGSDINVKLTENDWEAMKNECQGFLESPFSHQLWSLHAAASMKIIAAEEVQATENGLEVNMRKSKLSDGQTPDLPEQREF